MRNSLVQDPLPLSPPSGPAHDGYTYQVPHSVNVMVGYWEGEDILGCNDKGGS